MRGFKNFKGSDASGPSMYSYSMSILDHMVCRKDARNIVKGGGGV